MLALPGTLAFVMSDQRSSGGISGGMKICLRHADAQRRPVFITAKQQGSAGGENYQVAIGVTGLRTILAKGRYRNINQFAVARRQLAVPEPAAGEITGIF